MVPRSNGPADSRLLRAGGFVSGVVLIAPLVYAGLRLVVATLLDLTGVESLGYTVRLTDGLVLAVTPFTAAGLVALLSAISVTGASLYGTPWLQSDGAVELAFTAGGLAIATIVGIVILVGVLWETLLEGITKDSTIAIVASALGLLAVGWIATRSVASFRSGYRSPE